MVSRLEASRRALLEEREMLTRAVARIAEIDEDLALIDAELAIVTPKYERVKPPAPIGPEDDIK